MGLKESLASIEKRFGKGAIMKMSDGALDAPRISSGSLKLDIALGGGVAKGKIIEIYSQEACGKTGLALEILKNIQDTGGTGAIIDAEHAMNPEYAEQLGVNMDEIFIAQPSCGEEAFEITRELVRSGDIDVIIIDSVSALTPRAEIEGEVGESKMGLHAKMMSQAMRVLTGITSDNDCTLIFLNQLREKIGIMYGDPKVTTGGNALKFYASQRLAITKTPIKEGKEVIGFTQKIKCVKNKVGVPFKTAERDIIYGIGVDKVSELLDVSIDLNICQRKGAWFYYGEEVKLGQGQVKAIETLEDNPELQEEISKKVYEKLAGE